MNRLKIKARKLIFLIIILVCAGYLAANFKISLLNILKPPLKIANSISSNLKNLFNYKSLAKENKKLNKRLDMLTAKLVDLDGILLENERLRGLLRFKRELSSNSISALVIGRDISNWSSTIVINKGKNDGLTVDMPVVSFKGVVGKITEAGPSISRVILLTNPDFNIGARVQKSREDGLISGTAGGEVCVMKYLPIELQARKGDLVVSSGFGEIYPKGLMIGEIKSIGTDPGKLYKNALIIPSVDLSRLEEVLVITK